MSLRLGSNSSGPTLVDRARELAITLIGGQLESVGRFKGRGVVTCAGGCRYFTNAWILIKMLRHVGCNLPIELWHFGAEEIDTRMKRLLRGLEVQCIDATPYALSGPTRGKALKAIAIARSSFEEVLFLDADNTAVRDPSFLFNLPQYKKTGALFWPNTRYAQQDNPLWRILGLDYCEETETENGQSVINKHLCWKPLALAEQLNLHADVFYPLAGGGGGMFRLAWRKFDKNYAIPECPPQMLAVPNAFGEATDAVLCQHSFTEERLFQHRLFCKWDLLGQNPWVSGSFYEGKCHEFLHELRRRWNGQVSPKLRNVISPRLLLCQKSLVSNSWILTTNGSPAQVANGQTISDDTNELRSKLWPAFVKAPESAAKASAQAASGRPLKRKHGWVSLEMQELQFSEDGTALINKGADAQTGYFWELDGSTPPKLFLSLEKRRILTLRQAAEHCWEGEAGAKLRLVQEVYPHLANNLTGQIKTAERRKIIRSLGKHVHVTCSAEGIGDDIVAAYACAGLARMGIRVTFHTPHADWFSRVVEPRLAFTRKQSKSAIDLHYDYASQLRYGRSRAAWYCGAIHPLLKPAKPMVKLTNVKQRLPFGNYVIASPYTSFRDQWQDRHWPDSHWIRLANSLRERGYEFVAIGMSGHSAALLRTFSQTQAYWVAGESAEWVMDALLAAKAYVGVDNGTTHLAALLNIKSVAIHSQMPASFLWPDSSIRSIAPKASCRFCRWQEDRGFFQSCSLGCSAIATVSPEDVLTALLAQM